MSLQIRFYPLMLLFTTPVFAEPTSPVIHTGITIWQLLTIIGTGAGIFFMMYRIFRNHSKDLKDDLTKIFNQRFDAVDQRFDAVDQRLDGIDQRLNRIQDRLDQFNNEFMDHLKNHN